MQRRLTDHFPIQKELNEMNWDATPLKRADVIENLKKEAAEAAKNQQMNLQQKWRKSII